MVFSSLAATVDIAQILEMPLVVNGRRTFMIYSQRQMNKFPIIMKHVPASYPLTNFNIHFFNVLVVSSFKIPL